jgi:biopolymer transport protein ExbD
MQFQPEKKSDEIDINVIPMIDIFLMLLIFFMLSTTFLHKSEMNITLPKASEEQTEPTLDTITIAIDAEGNYFVNDQALVNSRMFTIREALRDAARDITRPVITIHADAQATHQSVIKVMDAARQLNLVNITFATTPLQEEEEAD